MPPPAAPPNPLLPKGLPFGWHGVGLVLLLVLGASVLLPRAFVENGPTICVFRRLTGRPCPGCGLTRSFTAMGGGDVHGALLHHPFGPLLFVAAGLALAAIAWRALCGRWPLTARQVAWVKPLAGGVLAVWLVWAAARAVGLAS